MIRIFKLFSFVVSKIRLLIALGFIVFFAVIAMQLTGNSMDPAIIFVLSVVILYKLGLRGKNLVLVVNFLVFLGRKIYEKLKGESSTDLLVNSAMAFSGILVVISIFLILQPKPPIIVSASDETICQVLGDSPAAYVNALVDTSFEPVQLPIQAENPIIHNVKGSEYYIFPLAIYEIAGVVVVKNTNTLAMLGGTDLGPVDIGLAWGELAKPENLKHIKVSSAFRLMMPSVDSEIGLSSDYIGRHMSHNHIIPSNGAILSAVKSLNKNEKVILRGYLVDVRVKDSNGYRSIWKSSLKRDDHLLNSGGGCEVFYVTDLYKEI